MSETYTGSNGLILPATGTDAGIWGNELNTNFGLIDTAVDGVEYIALTTGTLTLNIPDGTAGNGRYKLIVFQGSPGTTVAVSITPAAIQKIYKIVNQTAQNINFTNGTGTVTTVLAGNSEDIYCDGAGNVSPYSSANSSTFASIVDNGTLTVNGLTTLNDGLNVSSGVSNLEGGIGTSFIDASGPANLASLSVAGSTALTLPVSIGSQSLQQYIQSNSIPSYAAIPMSGGSFYILIYPGTVGSRTAIMVGSGVLANGATVSIPSGFVPGNTAFSVSLNQINTGNTSQPLCHITTSITSSGVITCIADDANSHNFSGTANWTANSVTTTY
jgi:hypothetical protein